MRKIKWLIAIMLGRKYFIIETEELQKDEVLFCGHRIYVPKKDKEVMK